MATLTECTTLCKGSSTLCREDIYLWENPQIRDGRMIKNIWVEIKRKSIKMILQLEGVKWGWWLVKQPFQTEGKNGWSHPDIDHKSGTETETRYRSDERLRFSRHLQEVSQLKVEHLDISYWQLHLLEGRKSNEGNYCWGRTSDKQGKHWMAKWKG